MRSVARVPITMLTDGACSKIDSPSSWATQPITPTSGLALPVCAARISPMRVKTFAFRFFANGTGVQQHDVGVVGRVAEIVTRGAQTSGCAFGVGHVHLAAKSFDVHSRLHSSKPNATMATVYQKSFAKRDSETLWLSRRKIS